MASASAGDCTPDTCPVAHGFLSEPPSLEGAVIILAAFAALIPINLWIGARGKTMTYTLIMVTGLLVEIMGYVGRLLLRSDPANKTYFLLFLLGTIMGPTFITAAIYTILPHVLALYGSDVSIVPEIVWANYFFLFCDIFTLVFQALGSVFAVEGFNKTQSKQGVNVIMAGLAFQIASILTFCGTYFWFMSRIVHQREFLDPRFADVYLSARFKTALLCTQVALAFILVRTVARLVQLCSGLDSALSQSQAYIPVLDGALVLLATILLAITPPGPAFGRAWGPTSPSKRTSRRHLASLDLGQRNSQSLSYRLRESPAPSPQGYHQHGNGYRVANSSNQRHSPSWPTHKRQASASSGIAEPPPYERSASNYARVPYLPPPQAASLSQQYGQGRVVESHVVAPGTDGSRTGGSGSGGRTRTRGSPRTYEDDMVRHDAIW